jgi:hypothetical protein
MNPLERDIERALVGMVKRHGGLCLKWVCPGFAGVPDRIILLPGARVIFAETKRPKGGKVAPLQEWWAKQLKRLGFPHVYIYNRAGIELLEKFIEGWGR